jgi:hypothetical protein
MADPLSTWCDYYAFQRIGPKGGRQFGIWQLSTAAARYADRRRTRRMKVDGGRHRGAITYQAVIDPEEVTN